MKQPELGNRLSSLRKEKGLTQQEIADKSGINIRTVQRIESGEVTPRPYTIRQFLDTMDLEYDEVMNGRGNPTNSVYKSAWILGIVCFIIGFPEFYFGSLVAERWLTSTESIVFLLVKLISVASYCFFVRGFLQMGKDHQFPLMAVASLFLIIGAIAAGLFDTLAMYHVIPFESVIVSESIYFGAVSILFGFSLFRSERITGRYGIAAGLLEVLAGLTFLSVFLGFVGLFILVPAEILEIVILYFAAEKVRKMEFAS